MLLFWLFLCFLLVLMAVGEIAKGIVYTDSIKTG